MLGRLRKGIALGKTWGAFIIFRMQIAIIGIEQQPRCGLYCCFQLQTVSGGLGSIRYPDIGLARIADAECASLNVRVFRIEARQVCSHRHTSQAPVRLDADLIVTDIFRPVSRSEEHTSELQSLMRISYACL